MLDFDNKIVYNHIKVKQYKYVIKFNNNLIKKLLTNV